MVRNSNMPLSFLMIEQNGTEQELTNAKIGIHFSILGFIFRRTYNPKKAQNLLEMNPTIQVIEKCGCGCS